MKIGEVVNASVSNGLDVKLELENPEELKVGYPVIVEGKKYDFYCIVKDIYTPSSELIERIACSSFAKLAIPLSTPGLHQGFTGSALFYKAQLKVVQLIDKNGKTREVETIPHYFAPVRLARKGDVEKIYTPTKDSLSIGNLRGIKDFEIPLDLSKLTEKPFAIFGRTGSGKSVLCKILCCSIIAKQAAVLLIFDMHQEYGMFSKTDNSPGLKFFFPANVEIFTLDPDNKAARVLLIDPREITPSDLIVAFQDLSPAMIDAIYAIQARKRGRSLIEAIKTAAPEEYEGKLHAAALQALKRRVERLDRFTFIKSISNDFFAQIISLIKAGQSIVLDFGRFGNDSTAYLFIANLLTRRLYDFYVERGSELPRLVLFLEEAHKFLAREVLQYTIFDKLARETRKFNLILALVDQRPARIDEEVKSQLANRFILTLKEPSDISSSLAGVPDRNVWEIIVGTIPPRTVLVIGDAIKVPTVIEIMNYDSNTLKQHLKLKTMDAGEIARIAEQAEEIFR
jgi:DNA helicase HerA-like ATPase